MTKASAFRAGVVPERILPAMYIVSVMSLPIVNSVVLKFSSDCRKASAAADRIAGRM